ncbi:MAG: YihY/virulence factor BrkB family protein [Planctomycetaceae bacterium]
MSRRGELGSSVRGALARLDRAQRRRAWTAFPLAVVKKFGDDAAGSLAALVAYYGFFSVFPLLLVLVTLLGAVLSHDPGLRERVLSSAIGQFPVVGTELQRNVGAIRGSGLTLAVGLVGAVWAGTAVVNAFAHAMDEVWNVPRRARGPFWKARARAVVGLVILGVSVGLSAALSAVAAGLAPSLLGAGLALVLAAAIAAAAIAAGFRALTAEALTWRDVAPGAAIGGLAWVALQAIGVWFVRRQIAGASDVFGVFAIVLGMLSWLYLAAQVLLFSAEVNVVWRRHLWPRSLFPPPTLEADRVVLARQAAETAALPEQRVEVRFEEPTAADDARRSSSARRTRV